MRNLVLFALSVVAILSIERTPSELDNRIDSGNQLVASAPIRDMAEDAIDDLNQLSEDLNRSQSVEEADSIISEINYIINLYK